MQNNNGFTQMYTWCLDFQKKQTVCKTKTGTKCEPKMGTKCEPKTSTIYEPKMGTDSVPFYPGLAPRLMRAQNGHGIRAQNGHGLRAQNGHEIRAQNGYSNVFISGLFCPLAKTQAGPHLHARSLYTNHAPSLDRNPSPHLHTMLLSGEHGLAPRAGSPGC